MATHLSLTFDEDLEERRGRPVYVVLGVQGSGTNLLSRMLTRIFGFSVLHDRSLVFNAAARLGTDPAPDAVAREIRRFRRIVSPTGIRRRIRRRLIKRVEFFEGLFDQLQPASVRTGAEFALLLYAYRAYVLGASEMGIKSDDIWEHIDAIDTVLPNRRIILLTRDFRDNLVSIAGKPFGPVEPVCAAQYVKRRFAPYQAEYRRAGALGYHVRFETLVERPGEFVETFARHFRLVPRMDPEAVLKDMPRRPNKIARWKGLAHSDLAWCEAILRDELLGFGYAPVSATGEAPTSAALAVASVRDAFKRIPQKVRHVIGRLNV